MWRIQLWLGISTSKIFFYDDGVVAREKSRVKQTLHWHVCPLGAALEATATPLQRWWRNTFSLTNGNKWMNECMLFMFKHRYVAALTYKHCIIVTKWFRLIKTAYHFCENPSGFNVTLRWIYLRKPPRVNLNSLSLSLSQFFKDFSFVSACSDSSPPSHGVFTFRFRTDDY